MQPELDSWWWPELEYWVLWQSIVTVAVAMGAVMIGFVKSRWGRVIGITVLTFITLYAIALAEKIKTKPDRDHVYLFVNPNRTEIIDGKILLFTKSTGILDGVKICIAKTSDYGDAKKTACFVKDFDEENLPFTQLPPGQYTLNSDTKSNLGKVLQRIHIEEQDGKAITVSSEVVRIAKKKFICTLPERKGGKPCGL